MTRLSICDSSMDGVEIRAQTTVRITDYPHRGTERARVMANHSMVCAVVTSEGVLRETLLVRSATITMTRSLCGSLIAPSDVHALELRQILPGDQHALDEGTQPELGQDVIERYSVLKACPPV